MDYQTITYAVADNIAVITLNRPDVMNALSTQMRAEITDAVRSGGREARGTDLTLLGPIECTSLARCVWISRRPQCIASCRRYVHR